MRDEPTTRATFRIAALLACLLPSIAAPARAENPIVAGRGLCDPQVRIYGDRAYLYATRDASPSNRAFVMNEWWVWASDDLRHWTQVSTLRPEQTYFGKPSSSCWAADAIARDGKYFIYFSRGPREIGVVVGDSPAGPWRDPIGKPLVSERSTPTDARDPAIFVDDDGTPYLVFGVWDFHIARLNPDMTSLAEVPRKITLDRKMGPYGPGKTDDKPYLHKRGDTYYLSWGCYYATGARPDGPFVYQDSIIVEARTEPAFRKALTFDRHGSFFDWHGQSYFACNDQSWPGSTPRYRNSILSYVHYRDDGTIEPITIDRVGVGAYDATRRIEAENFFRIGGGGASKRQAAGGGFEVRGLREGAHLAYPNVAPLRANATLTLRVAAAAGATVEVRAGDADGALLGRATVPAGDGQTYADVAITLANPAGAADVCLVFRGGDARLDWVRFD